MGFTGRELVWSFNRQTQADMAEAGLEQELQECMKCRFFYGSGRQCLAEKCVREENKPAAIKEEGSACADCPYRQSEGYCFPCMKKLLGKKGKETERFVQEDTEGKKDG